MKTAVVAAREQRKVMVTDFSVKAQSVRNTTLDGVSFLSPPPPELDWRREGGGGGGGGIREGGREGERGWKRGLSALFPPSSPHTYQKWSVCLSVVCTGREN